jgi:hypothetical protein
MVTLIESGERRSEHEANQGTEDQAQTSVAKNTATNDSKRCADGQPSAGEVRQSAVSHCRRPDLGGA